MQAPPANAQESDTPFKDVVELATAIARAKGLDAADAEWPAASASGCSLPRPTATRTSGNARSNKYKGSLQTGVSEDHNGQKKWAAIKTSDRGASIRR